MSISSAELRTMGIDPLTGRRVALRPQRAIRHTGEHALRKAAALAGGMNSLEREFAQHLDAQICAGQVTWWAFNKLKLRLADGAWYRPDFLVMYSEGRIEFCETKGFMREAARVRLHVAADIFPFRFSVVRKTRDGWSYELVHGKFDEIFSGETR